jgi:hypothetical protein
MNTDKVVAVQPVRSRTDDAPVDDQVFQVEGGAFRIVRKAIFEVFQDVQILPVQRRFETIWESDQKLVLIPCRSPCNNTQRTPRMNKRIVRPADFDQ